MDNKNLRDLILRGVTYKEFPFLDHTVKFKTLYETEMQRVHRKGGPPSPFASFSTALEMLKRSIHSVNDSSDDVIKFVDDLDEVNFPLLWKIYSRFIDWLNEDSQIIVTKAIRDLVETDISLWHWNVLRATNFQDWDNKWHFYRYEWVNQNMIREQRWKSKDDMAMLETICTFINPEAMKNMKTVQKFEDGRSHESSRNIQDEIEKLKKGERAPDEVDPEVAKMCKTKQGDQIDVIEVKNGKS